MDLEMLKTRAGIIQAVRSFFIKRGYLELDTPLLSDNLIPESCLEVFQTERLYPKGSRKENKLLWLVPSPEIWMKKLITKHRVNVFQICKCFRNGEQSGFLHNSEFTMLEYYTMDADYNDSLTLTEELFKELNDPAAGYETFFSGKSDSLLPFDRITVADAFNKYAGFDLFKTADEGAGILALQARKLGLDPLPGMTFPEIYDLIFIHCVEPNLKKEKPVALLDYPAFIPCLAKNKNRTVERWELYYRGIELANCFSEETDPQKVKNFFINEEKEKEKNALVKHKVDHNYWKMFDDKSQLKQCTGSSFPKCSGVAMGLDRLIMLLANRETIDSVLIINDEY